MPEVSVIIPTYNAASYLVQAVESVLAQTYKDFEILVVDDGSTDQTPELMNKYDGRVRYLAQINSGVAIARNRGMELSNGRYIAFLDADDTWFSHKLEQQLDALRRNPNCRAASTDYVRTTSDLTIISESPVIPAGPALDALLEAGTVFFISTVICERSVFEKTGGFDPSLSQCADWDMWIRVAAETEFAHVQQTLVTYRQHESNMSRNTSLLERDSLLVLDKAFSNPILPEQLRKRRRRILARNYRVLAGTYIQAGHYVDFVRCALLALSLDLGQSRFFLGSLRRIVQRFGRSSTWT